MKRGADLLRYGSPRSKPTANFNPNQAEPRFFTPRLFFVSIILCTAKTIPVEGGRIKTESHRQNAMFAKVISVSVQRTLDVFLPPPST